MFALIKIAFGLVLYIAAVAVVFTTADARFGRSISLTLVAVVAVIAPLVLTGLFLRAFRKIDPRAGFLSNLLGVAGVLSLLVLVGIGGLLRRPLALAFANVPGRYPALGGGAISHAATTVGRWITPRSPPPIQPVREPAAPIVNDRAPASAPVTTRVRPPAGAAPAIGGSFVLEACDLLRMIFTVDLGGSDAQEIVIGCEDGVHVLWLHPDLGTVVERTYIRAHPPKDQRAIVRDLRVLDVDGDHLPDILTCILVISEHGGTRGGGVWLYRGQPGGLFAPGKALFSDACGGVALGDVTGDGRDELVVARVGNPFLESNPSGELLWFARVGRIGFVRRGRRPLLANPVALWLADVNHDSILDVVVDHGWDNQRPIALPGSSSGPGPMDPDLAAPPEPERRLGVRVRLDDDARLDAVGPGSPPNYDGTLRLELTAPLSATPTAITPAPDHQDLDD